MNPYRKVSEYTAEQVRAVDHAVEAVKTILRLDKLEEETRSLTFNQSTDRTDAVRSWNDAADILPGLDRWGSWDGDSGVHSMIANLKAHSEAVRAQQPNALRDEVEAFHRAISGGGRDGTRRAPDEIRAQLASREMQHDYPFLTSDEMRQLPELDGETRTITDFANGASLFVSDFRSQLAIYARTESPWLAAATVVTSDNGRPLVVPNLTGDPTVYTPGEGTAITASDVTLSTVTVTPVGYKALMYISAEALEDEDVNLTAAIARAQARAIGLAFGSAATTAVLAGINNGGTATGTGGAGTAIAAFFGYEDLLDLKYGRAAPYRTGGSFVMANGAIKKARKFKDQNGMYLWPGGGTFTPGQPATFDDSAVYEDPYLATPASATKSVVFGDLAAALIIKASPVRIAISTDFKFSEDVVAIKTVQRIALAVQDAAAAAYIVSANT